MKETINEIFTVLQDLDVKPTPHNVSILSGVFNCLREIYSKLEEQEHEKDGGRATDSEGPDGD